MHAITNKGFSVHDLEIQKWSFEFNIRRLEIDLQNSPDNDLYIQAGQLSNLLILRRILEIERSNLVKVNYELEKRKLQC